MRSALARTLVVLAAAAAAWAVAIAVTGGGTITALGLRLSSNNVWRPLIGAAACLALAVLAAGVPSSLAAIRRARGRVTPARAALALAVATTGVSLGWNSWTGSGPDSSAYVSQAALWRSGTLRVPVPLAEQAPWPAPVTTFVPFGYRAAPDGAAAIVPGVAPGLPMTMAALQTIAGPCAAFLVTPLSGGALVWLTFLIGRRLRTPAAGLMAAALVATSPALLFMLMWPMSDVPAAAWVALMTWLLLRDGRWTALGAGLAGAAGVLTRANIAVVVMAAAAWLLLDVLGRRQGRAGLQRLLLFGLGLAPAAAITAGLNIYWFGSPFSSGYGNAGDLLSASRIPVNLWQFSTHLIETSPLALLGLAALLVPVPAMWRRPDGRRPVWLCLALIASTLSVYLFWEPFPDWWYLRFLLPAWPALFVATAVALDTIAAPMKLARHLVTATVVVASVAGVTIAHDRGVFAVADNERRYATIGRLIDQVTEPSAVILTWQHAGSLRIYGRRDTLRYDVLDPAWLDRTIAWLSAQGRHPYILLEDFERDLFETRFKSGNAAGDLNHSPAAAWQARWIPGWVYLYDPLRRDAPTFTPGLEFEQAMPWCEIRH